MLDLEIVPELAIRHKLWEFILGMPMQQTIDILRKQDNLIKSVDFWYNDKSPFASDLILCLPHDGLKMYFDPFVQRLKMIEIGSMHSITLRYWAQYFNSANVVPTIQEILRIFGSTKALVPDEKEGDYRLCYRGITFIFSTPTASDQTHNSATSSPINTSSIVRRSANSSEPRLVVTRLYIFSGNNLADAQVPPELPGACFLRNVFLERLQVVRTATVTTELVFDLITQDLSVNPMKEPLTHRFTRTLHFGDSVQDVLSALGSPSRIFYKTEDKMKIHLPQSYRLEQPRRSDYFFNYFTLGLDVLFDAQHHRLIKFVLHTNQPGEYTFNTYYRCMFEIPIPASTDGLAGTEDKGPAILEDSETHDACVIVTPFIKWSEVHNRIEPLVDADPVVIHRETKPRKNPFGPTHAYGYQDMIFEVIPSNDYLVSVTIYSPPL